MHLLSNLFCFLSPSLTLKPFGLYFRQKSYLWTLLGVLSFDFVGFESCEIVGGGLASVLENLGPNPDSATQLEAASLFLRAFISSLRRKA